tara:strand:+ start:43 stop:369 length:327 start_codon:yes stop_codon:yes gene_type:complete
MFAKIIIAGSFIIICIAYSYRDLYEDANVWYKVSSDELNPGEIIALDMSRGYSTCDDVALYIIVNMLGTDEEVVLLFPNKGYWHTDDIDSVSVELQRIFGKLEGDLRK